MISFGKIAKIVLELLAKGQVGPCTFFWANLVLQLSNLGSVISLIQTAVSNTVKSANGHWEKTHLPYLRKLNKIRHATQYCHVLWNGASGFEVRDKKWRFTVDLGQKTCSCRYWQLSGIPCRHACAALFTMSDEPNNYVNACFSIDQYKTTYQHVLQPVEHESAWPVSPNPKSLRPRVKKMPGRPQTKRRQDPAE